jgi:enoyl-CoA hydratase/carnithine racemase
MSEILSESDGSILTLTLNRPDKQNAINREMYQTMADLLSVANLDPAISAVIIQGRGAHFTSGNDITDFLNNPPSGEDSPVAQFLTMIHNFSKPLLAAVSGNAIGIGTTLLFHCDVVVAAPKSNFAMPFVTLGLVPEAGSSILFPRLVGYQRAIKNLLTGESFDSTFALENGIVAEIASDPQIRIREIAQLISEQPSGAVIQTKALLKSELHEKVGAIMKVESELFSRALLSDEAKDAFMKFLAKKGK